MSSHDSGIRFYRVLSAQDPELGRCTAQVELVGNRLILRPDTTTWFEVPLDYTAARALIAALAGDAPTIVRCQHSQHGPTTVTVEPHGATASLRVHNTPRGALHILFDETALPELIMHLEDGASWLPR